MDVCKCIVPLQYGGTLNSHRATSPLVRLVKGEKRWGALDHFQGVLPQNWVGTEKNRTVTCIIPHLTCHLKSTDNDRRKSLALFNDGF
ncbi:uncharacterized protein TNCV_633851 [Trichonephila clavipes]|nr:uncharacterized protein TNCV_633851 [Trichonephila clavipes]